MRIRVVQLPAVVSIDGVELSRFRAGGVYDVGTLLGSLMLAERWAEPVTDDESALLTPSTELAPSRASHNRGHQATVDKSERQAPRNLIRESSPPSVMCVVLPKTLG